MIFVRKILQIKSNKLHLDPGIEGTMTNHYTAYHDKKIADYFSLR